MKRRPLCIFCVLFLTVQAIRVLFFGAGDYTSALGQIVNRNNKGEINLILTGTADRIDEKESVTAVRVKGNAVSFYSGSDRKIARQSVFGKSDGHRSSYDFSQELPRKIWEEKVLVYLEKEDAAHIKIGNKLKIKGKASAFETARNPGNFDQRAYYKRQKIGAYVWADEVGILSGQTECIRQFLHEFRQGWKKLLVGCLGSYYGNTISAILLGEKGDLDPYMKKLYQKNGIGHLLAISGVKTLKLDILLVPETRINWAFVPLHIAIIYILKLCLDEEIIPRCRFPCSRGYFTKCINWQKKQ